MQLPFVVYWLIVKDFFGNLDVCDNSTETGYCMSDSQCSNIANGTTIGSCDREASSSVCCQVTLNYYNTTYSLKPMFESRNPTDRPQKVMLFSSSAYSSFQIDYGDKRISSKRSTRKREVIFNEKVHACVAPDRIIWPVTALYSRESREFRIRRPFSGTSHLFIVELNKVYEEDKETLTKECLSNLNAPESHLAESGEDELPASYLKVNNEVRFPLRTFFSPKIQNLRSANFTDELDKLFPEPEPHEDKSSNHETCKEEDSTCDKQEWVDILGGEKLEELVDTAPSQSDIQFEKRKLHVHSMKPHKHHTQTEEKSNILSHNYRKPVLTDSTHDMRKPVKSETTHDTRRPVSLDKSHDMRKPVSLDESHDLRWPVVEEDSDLRNIYKSIYKDAFSEDNSLENTIKDGLSKTDPLGCEHKITLSKEQLKNFDPRKREMLSIFYKDTREVCGDFTNTTAAHVITPDRKSPWMVSLLEKRSGKYRNKCSGALLNSKWVITVAHCVDMKYKSDFKLLLGRRHKGNFIEADIDQIVVHKDFNRGMFENDLALIRMKNPVKFTSHIKPICFPDDEEADLYLGNGDMDTEYGIPVFLSWRHKQKLDYTPNQAVPLIENSECEMLYSVGKNKERIKDTFICAGKDDGNCDSESGSSLIAPNTDSRWMLIGLVSWGSMCSNLEQPSVYVRIESYLDWITHTISCYEIYF